MSSLRWISVLLWLLVGPLATAAQPNILLVMADDLGYSDLGCYGSEIATPHLDGLAAGGLRFTQFYNTGRCWPTRGSLLTGYYAQQIRRDQVPGVPSGNRGKRPAWAPLLPEMLKPAGYRSYHSGKWHIDSMPIACGFDRSYYLSDQGRFFNPLVHYEDDAKLPPVPKGTSYYGTTAIADHAIACLRQHAQDHSEAPFFHYLAFTAPHFPLHALPEDIAKYRDRYRSGWEQVRGERHSKQRQLGFPSIALSEVEPDVGPPYPFPKAMETLGAGEVNRPLAWDALTERQQEFQADKMAVHAAMIDRIDQELGRVLDQIRAMDALEETLILFLSDNGASAEIMVRADGHDPQAAPGSADSYLCLGPGWSTVSNTPFRRHKTWVHEGGIATPLIVHWPRGIADGGTFRHTPGHVIDIVPTLLEIANVQAVASRHATTVPPPPGKSLLPILNSDQSLDRECLWWSHEGNRGLRKGDFKVVAAGKAGAWELYDLAKDRGEQNDLADRKPAVLQTMIALWEAKNQEFTTQARRP
ncbi:Arylsulfatase [Rosistilla carotiformis]|uniref:Arylsulfatase n=1 Tax=Rosistilla carotiformis TaxID=2528017 RepID=A0A518JR17_9BACT|nr:arylsulfatase [Rosistilla carotiformis]QDV67991.1 Arylsulfatase [Rosistilla carotiformis]